MNALPPLLTGQLDIWTTAETEKKSGRGRSSGNGTSVYGIKKLRELILELAVRGKLVPQDPDDEPAGELLKRIQAEKAKLVAEGKIKKDKPLPPISDEEKPFELPQGWECARLADLVNILNGRAYKKEELLGTGTPVLRVGNLFTSEHWYYSDLTLEDEKYCNKGDLLFAWPASFGPFIWEGTKAIFHYHIWKLDLYGCDFIYKRYLYTFLLEQAQKIKASGHGVMMIHMTKEKMEKLIVFLPPIEEQHRIVAKVDELMALCDQLETQHINAAEAHEKLVNHMLGTLTQSQSADDFNANWQRIAAHFDTLFTTEVSIDALKQTLLQLAVMGKLVPQDPEDEPARELLKRIQAEKDKLIAEGKIKKDKPLPLISNEEKPFELPYGWEWTTLASISLINPRNNVEDNSSASFISMTMIGSGFNSSHNQEIRLWKEIKQGFTHFAEGDIGVAKITPCFENSKACVFSGLVNGIGAGTTELHIVRRVNETLVSRFVLAYFKSPQFLLIGEKRMTGTAGQKRLPKEFVESNPFPLPPLPEQHRIVTKVDELMTLCDQLKSRITQASQLQKKLADVMVEQAIAS